MKNSRDFLNFISQNISKSNFDCLPVRFGSSKKMVTMRLLHPEKLTNTQLNILLELTGLTYEDFKKYIN